MITNYLTANQVQFTTRQSSAVRTATIPATDYIINDSLMLTVIEFITGEVWLGVNDELTYRTGHLLTEVANVLRDYHII